jgi:hypothetical protein
MRRLSLSIASFTSILTIPVLLYLALSSGSIVFGLLIIGVGVPLAIAHSVVFDYVGEKMDVARKEKETTPKAGDTDSVTKGTPWESDPGHTTE